MIRNIFHSILGFTVAYSICNATGVYEMNTVQSIILGFIVGIFVGAIIGVGIEYFQLTVLNQKFDETDVLRTVIGAVVGGLVQTPNVTFISKWMLLFCGVVCFAEIMRLIYKRK